MDAGISGLSQALLYCKVLLICVFAVSVLSKVFDYSAFREASANLVPLPRFVQLLVAPVVIAAETGTIVLLGHDPWSRLGFSAAALLLTLFSVAIGYAVLQGSRISCNCFGHDERPVGPADVWRNVVLIAICGWGTALSLGASGAWRSVPPTNVLLVTIAAIATSRLIVRSFAIKPVAAERRVG